MRTHAQKQHQPQPAASLYPVRLKQHTFANQAIQALPQANAEGRRAETHASSAPTRFAHDFSRIPLHSTAPVRLQAKLKVNAPGDIYEQEANHISEQVTNMLEPQLQRTCACGGGCPTCRNEQADHEHLQTKRVRANQTDEMAASPIVHEALRSEGQPLSPSVREFMEPRFGHDFSRVRVHTDDQAANAASAVQARAYTVGRDIVFGSSEYAPATAEGKRLLAHELTHVVQQSHTGYSPAVQRQSFTGGPGTTAKDKDRPLTDYEGPMDLPKGGPGGKVIPGTAGTGQNCSGDSCSINKFINWPYLGYEVPNVALQADWGKATDFVPTGCTRVNCSGVSTGSTRCKDGELELIAFLYKWPVTLNVNGKTVAGTQSDFHMIGRDVINLPRGWHSKMDRRERVEDIRDPWQSLHDAYPHTMLKDRIVQQLCFCCKQSDIKAT